MRGHIRRATAPERHAETLLEAIGRAASLDDIYAAALTRLGDELGVRRAAVLVRDQTGSMRFAAFRGLSDAYRAAVDGHCPWRHDDPAPEPILISDVTTDPSLAPLRAALAAEAVSAVAFVPLCFGGQLLGKLMLYYDAPHGFAPWEISAARSLANQVSLALEQAHDKRNLEARLAAEQEARRAAERAMTLQRRAERHKDLLIQAGHLLSRSLETTDVFAALSELVVPAFADWYVVHVVDPEGTLVPLHVSHEDRDKVALAWQALRRWPNPGRPTLELAAVVRDGRSALYEHLTAEQLVASAHDDDHLHLMHALHLSSAMVVPIRLPDRTAGAMTFIGEAERRFNVDDLSLAEALANRAGAALDHARLYREARDATRQAQAVARHLELLGQASAQIASALSPDEALTELARFAVSSVADYCVTYRLEDDDQIRRVGLMHADADKQSLVEDLGHAARPKATEHPGVASVLRSGEPVLFEDITDEQLVAAAQDQRHLNALRALETRSSVIVPLAARGRTLGAVMLATTARSGRRYIDKDLVFARELADRAALLLDNIRLFAEAQDASRARDEMLAVVSHDLRSPLNTISTASELLATHPPVAQQQRILASVRRAAEQMNRLLDDLLDVTRIVTGRLGLRRRPCDLGAVVSEVISVHAPVAESRSIRLLTGAASGAVVVDADPDRVAQALTNLVGNAVKFTPDGGAIHLEVAHGQGEVRVSVSDDGPGIPPEQLPHLFDRFWRADRDNRSGIGLGLTIAKGIAVAHGGDIEVTSRFPGGSRFTLVLPHDAPRATPGPARAAPRVDGDGGGHGSDNPAARPAG